MERDLPASRQAKNFGCDIRSNISGKKLEITNSLKQAILSEGSVYTSYAVILSPGRRSRTPGVKGEDEFKGKYLPVEKLKKVTDLSSERYCGVSEVYIKAMELT